MMTQYFFSWRAISLFSVFFVIYCYVWYQFRHNTWKWWVKIQTDSPHCTYYFGPFDSPDECQLNASGYVEDLKQENAGEIDVTIQWCAPEQLTVCWD